MPCRGTARTKAQRRGSTRNREKLNGRVWREQSESGRACGAFKGWAELVLVYKQWGAIEDF